MNTNVAQYPLSAAKLPQSNLSSVRLLVEHLTNNLICSTPSNSIYRRIVTFTKPKPFGSEPDLESILAQPIERIGTKRCHAHSFVRSARTTREVTCEAEDSSEVNLDDIEDD